MVRTLWVLPTTAVGLVLALIATPFGARWQWRLGVIEVYGGLLAWLLEHGTLLQGGALAITFGEVILGRSPAALDLCREHEHVHVRQARRWGPLFLPAYVIASVIAKLRGDDMYRGNVFEREAFAVSDARKK